MRARAHDLRGMKSGSNGVRADSPTVRFARLVREVRACTVCAAHLPFAPRPVLRVSPTARVLIVGQAPGRRVHASGVPWDDPSGDRLRAWLQLSREIFYDESRIAIIPTGMCYPGKGPSGDLPPRRECAGWKVRPDRQPCRAH